MKRLVLRLAALVSVLVVVLIAIAYARRSTEPAKQPALPVVPESVAAASESPATPILIQASPQGSRAATGAAYSTPAATTAASRPPPIAAALPGTAAAPKVPSPPPPSAVTALPSDLFATYTRPPQGDGPAIGMPTAYTANALPAVAGNAALPPPGAVAAANAAGATINPLRSSGNSVSNIATTADPTAIKCSGSEGSGTSAPAYPGAMMPPASAVDSSGPRFPANPPVAAGAGSTASQYAVGPSAFRRPSAPAAARPSNMPSTAAQEPAPLAMDPMARPTRLGRFADAGQSDAGAAAADAAPLEGTGQPGKKQLEGPQSPQLTIQKIAPSGIQVGKPAVFRVTVANVGHVAANGVEVRDAVPKRTQLISTNPQCARGPDGELIWQLGTLKPNEEGSVEMQVMPIAEGEIGSVATVCFRADATARTVATKPELVVKTAAPTKVLIGDKTPLTITISNPGTGVATGVVLEEHVPANMRHPAGNELHYEIGTLKPGESRRVQLNLSAAQPGTAANLLLAKGDGSLKTEERCQWDVLAPQLDVSVVGRKKLILEHETTSTVWLSNPGTAPARQVQLVAYLPRGLKFVSANNSGRYDPATHSAVWLLEELPANDRDKVELTTMPIEAGAQKIRIESRADKGISVEKEQPITVEGIAAVLFDVRTLANPIAVGEKTDYEVHVVNRGSKAATNVALSVLIPQGLRPLAAEGPTHYEIGANRVQFEPLARLAAKAETTYRVRVQGLQPGDLRVRVQLSTDEVQDPVTKEESTTVYRDE